MVGNSNKKYKCPYCSQTSSRKYNIDIHRQRKHQQALAKHLNQASDLIFQIISKSLTNFHTI